MLFYLFFVPVHIVLVVSCQLLVVSCQFEVPVFWIFLLFYLFCRLYFYISISISIYIYIVYLSIVIFLLLFIYIISIFSVSIKCYKSEKKNNARQFNSNIKIKNIVKQKYKKCHIKQKVCKEKVKRKDFKVAKKEVQNDQEVPKNKCYQWRTQRSSSILHQEILVKQKFNDDH